MQRDNNPHNSSASQPGEMVRAGAASTDFSPIRDDRFSLPEIWNRPMAARARRWTWVILFTLLGGGAGLWFRWPGAALPAKYTTHALVRCEAGSKGANGHAADVPRAFADVMHTELEL